MNPHRREAWHAIQRYLERKEAEQAHQRAQQAELVRRYYRVTWVLSADDGQFLRSIQVDSR